MDPILPIKEWLTSYAGAALTISFLLFFVTLFMTAKQWIGFPLTFLFLLFTLLSGITIANQDVIRSYLTTPPTEHSPDMEIKIANFQQQILKLYDNLKAELEIQKHKLQATTEEVHDLKAHSKEPSPTQAATPPTTSQ